MTRVPVGTSMRTHRFALSEINCLHGLSQATGKDHFYEVGVVWLFLCSQVLLLPLGVPPLPAPGGGGGGKDQIKRHGGMGRKWSKK